MRSVHMMHMSPFRGAIFMMQMSQAMVQMQHLSMMVTAYVFTRDANVSLVHAVMRMSTCGYVMMQMFM